MGLVAIVRGGIDVAQGRHTGPPAFGWPADQQSGEGNPQLAFQPASAFPPVDAFQPAGGPMSAQPVPRAGAQADMGVQGGWGPEAGWGPAMGKGPAMGREPAVGTGGSDYAGYGTASPANWYPDPRNSAMLRWWDGQGWTSHTRPYN